MTRRSPVVVVALLAATVVGLPAAASAQKPHAERPTYAVGDRWLRGDGTWEVTRVERDTYVFATGRGDEVHLSRNLGVMKVVLEGAVAVELDPALDVAWPLEVGKWAMAYPTVLSRSALRYGNARDQARHTWKVEGYEDVSVPAATFKAFRITHAVSVGVQWSASLWAFTLWYAPAVRQSSREKATCPAVATAVPPPPSPPTVATTPKPPPGQAAAEPQPSLARPAPASPVAGLPVSDTEAPRIAINYPPPAAQLDRAQIVVLGLVTDNAGLDRVLVSVNGAMIAAGGSAATGKSHSVRVPVTLQPGENVIEVTAIDNAGNAAQAVRTVTRTAPARVAPAPATGERWAVVIGIGRYESPAIPTLRYTVPDAEAMYRTLIGPAGFKKDNVLLLTDRVERKPTLKNIKWALGTFLARSARRDDTVVIFFAGHGAPETDQRGLERDGLAKYLIPSDADPDDQFLERLTRSRGRAIITASPGRGVDRAAGARSRNLHVLPGGRAQGCCRRQPRRDRDPAGAVRVPRAAGHRQVALRGRQPAPGDEGRDGRGSPAHPRRAVSEPV